MQNKISTIVQITLKWLIPAAIIFVIFYSTIETNQQKKELVVVEYTTDGTEVVSELHEKGYISGLSYVAGLFAVELGFDIDAGGFELVRSMGPVSFLAVVFSPEFKYIAINEGLRKEQIVEILGEKLDWNEEDKRVFTNDLPLCAFTGGEGYLFPGKYLVHKNEDPIDVRRRMEDEFV